MVEEKIGDNLGSFLFSLSAVFNVDIPILKLVPRDAEAALKFTKAVQRRAAEGLHEVRGAAKPVGAVPVEQMSLGGTT